MIRRTQPPLNPPSVTRAVQHALVAGLAVLYIGAAAMQLVRDNVRFAAIDLLIATLLGLVLSVGSRTFGRVMANYGRRRVVNSASQERWCSWCGECIPSGSQKVAHHGTHDGKPFLYHHHVECDSAAAAWAGKHGSDELIAHPEPGTMERGRPYSRGMASNGLRHTR